MTARIEQLTGRVAEIMGAHRRIDVVDGPAYLSVLWLTPQESQRAPIGTDVVMKYSGDRSRGGWRVVEVKCPGCGGVLSEHVGAISEPIIPTQGNGVERRIRHGVTFWSCGGCEFCEEA